MREQCSFPSLGLFIGNACKLTYRSMVYQRSRHQETLPRQEVDFEYLNSRSRDRIRRSRWHQHDYTGRTHHIRCSRSAVDQYGDAILYSVAGIGSTGPLFSPMNPQFFDQICIAWPSRTSGVYAYQVRDAVLLFWHCAIQPRSVQTLR